MTTTKTQFDRKRPGSLHDRGSADSYYRRSAAPHWYPEGTHKGKRVTDLDDYEVAEYNAGYSDNEEAGEFKEW